MSRSPWLISARQDLLWLHGSVVPALALLLLFKGLPVLTDARYTVDHPALWLLLAWGVFFDGTHVIGTYARTYLAPPQDRDCRAAAPGASSLLWVASGPAIALLDGWLLPQHPSLLGQSGGLFQHFLLLAYLWAYYHLLRQHYGFLVLYQRRLDRPIGVRVDVALLWLAGLHPYLRYALSPAYLASGLPQPLPVAVLPTLRVLLDAAMALSLLLLLPHYLRRLRQQPVGPRELFLLIVAVFHSLVFALLDHLLLITAVLTLFHNLQYHRIVWQYEQGRGRTPLASLGRYLGLGCLFGLLWYGPRILGVALIPPSLWRNVLLGLGWGIAFHHYAVDARIWRVRRTPSLAATLDRGGVSACNADVTQ